jgi:hypothetical protein
LLAPGSYSPNTYLPANIRTDLKTLIAGATYHQDVTTAISVPTATDLPSVVVAANAIAAALNGHFGSYVYAGSASAGYMPHDTPCAHLANDTADVVSTAAAVDLPTSEALLNACQSAYNTHCGSTSYHVVADATNTNSTTTATTLATAEALANALIASINAHFANSLNSSHFVGQRITVG